MSEKFVSLLNELLKTKNLTEEEVVGFMKDSIKKAFEKENDLLRAHEDEEPEPAEVEVEIDLSKEKVSIKRIFKVVDDYSIVSRFREIVKDDKRIVNLGLDIGDEYIEEIDIDKIESSRANHIKILFIQKLSEAEKIKLYRKFSQFKGEILTAIVHKKLKKDNVLLDYNGDSIFMPANELSPLDIEKGKIKIGKPLSVYVLEIEEISKDAQIIASRKNSKFIEKLIEREIDDVQDGIVKIESISREPGIKTKVAVSTIDDNVDPVGTIIGVKGQKIKPIINEICGERLDIIKYNSDIKQFIAESLLPANIKGIKIEKASNPELWYNWEATVVVDDDQFLSALGKRGVNIKLAALLTRTKIDVKKVQEANDEGIEWEKVTKTKFVPQNNSTNIINFDEFENIIEDIANNDEDSKFTESDYDLEEDFGVSKNNNDDEDYYDPEFEDEDYDKY